MQHTALTYMRWGAMIGAWTWLIGGLFIPGTDGTWFISIPFAAVGAVVGAIIWFGDWIDNHRNRSIIRRQRQLNSRCLSLSPWNPPRRAYTTQEATGVAAAENRAKGLLYELLTPVERYQLATGGKISIPGPNCTYELNQSDIRVNRYGKDVGSLCTISTRGLPASDLMIARLLHLKFNQWEFTTKIARRY